MAPTPATPPGDPGAGTPGSIPTARDAGAPAPAVTGEPAAPPVVAPPPARLRRSLTQQMRRVVSKAVSVQRRAPTRARRGLAYPILALRVLLQVLRQWARDRCPQQAASLAFQTTLSIVPLIAAGLALLRATGSFEAESTLVRFLSSQVIPVSREEIAGYLLTWAGNMSFATAGVAGLLATLVLSFFLFSSVEGIFNDIWRTEKRRSLAQKFVVFYALVTIVPALLGVSLYHMARYGLTAGPAGALGSLGAVWGALFFANKLLPATPVSTRAAAVSALVTALAFEAAKNLFQLYVAHVAFQRYAGVYGPLGLVPIFLVWIYSGWLLVLLGAEVGHSLQNLGTLERLDGRQTLPPERELFEKVNGVVAARLLTAVVAEFQRGGKGLTRTALATRYDVGELVVDRVFRRLRDKGLVIEVEGDAQGYLPARPPSSITLAEVLACFRGSDVLAAGMTGERSRLDVVLADVEGEVARRARAVTFAELAGPPAAGGD